MAIGPNGSRFVENIINDLENSFDHMIRDSYIRKNMPVTFAVGCTLPDEELASIVKDHVENSYLSAGWTSATFYYYNNNGSGSSCSLTLEVVEGIVDPVEEATEPNEDSGEPVDDEEVPINDDNSIDNDGLA